MLHTRWERGKKTDAQVTQRCHLASGRSMPETNPRDLTKNFG